MKWPQHRTGIARTLQIAQRESSIMAVISAGLRSHTSTVDILQGIIGLLYAERLLLMEKLDELNRATEKHLIKDKEQ